MDFKHISVLYKETIDSLNIKNNGIYVDCTLGGGGHSLGILERLSSDGLLIGIDQDEDAISAASERLKAYSNKRLVKSNFEKIDEVLDNLNIEKVDGIIMDLGVSSYQLDEGDRGFSYMQDAKLDMRMDRNQEISAYDVVNFYEEERLHSIIKAYGEERYAKKIAYNICKYREKNKIETTFELVDIIKASIPAKDRREGPHPAKRTFQAIRIEVNRELEVLENTIEKSINRLNPMGRMSIITFHSLEDRIVKNKFKDLQNPCKCPKEFPICVCNKKPIIKIITKKPLEPSNDEIEDNSRARSSKLRIAEKL